MPYVSSEDIDKGARWSSDIAKELEDSTFGILCVTKDNMEAPWLSFEAGALSKTMDKSFVTPFLFDVKGSEVKGPILQFQSTAFQKNDIKKLVITLNKACGEVCIEETRLHKAFDVWFPLLENQLNAIKNVTDELEDAKGKKGTLLHSAEILEEILDLTRNNQKLLRNPDNSKIVENIEELKELFQRQISQVSEIEQVYDLRRNSRKYHPMLIEELVQSSMKRGRSLGYGFLITLSLFKQDFPWIYDAGRDLLDLLKTNPSKAMKKDALLVFKDVVEFTFHNPMMREFMGNKKEFMYLKEIPYILMRNFDDLFENDSKIG